MGGGRRACVIGFLALATAVTPAGAVRVSAGISGHIDVYPDLGACGWLDFGVPVTAAGVFAEAGVVTGPGAAAGAVRGATPVVVSGESSWYGCLPDAYPGAQTAVATYELAAGTGTGEFTETLVCVVRVGVVTCT
jgi:hypothetical protein